MKANSASLWQKLFGDSVRAFGVVSVLFLASLAIAPAKNYLQRMAPLSARLPDN